jgi:hypothetical protein
VVTDVGSDPHFWYGVALCWTFEMLVVVGKQTFEIEDVIREAIPGDLLSRWLRYLQSREGEAFRNYFPLPPSPFPNQNLKVSKLKSLSFLPPSPKPKTKKKTGVK